jgi:hypothetical protein
MGNEESMDPLERSAKVQQEADQVMQAVGLYDILQPYGRVVFTGSYLLQVMVYPDIDLYIPKVSIAQLFQIGGQIAACEMVYEVVFQRPRVAELPGGLYLKPRIQYGDWGRPWKIDIWSVDDALIEQNMVVMRHFQERMTPELREQIVRYKASILTERHRTPPFSGYHIYRAFIDEGLSDHDEVTQYLIEHGIQMA